MQSNTQTPKTHVACPACFKENRVPLERLHQHPKCGSCGAALLEGKPVALTEGNFDAFLKPDGLPVVVDFWAPWCGPCRAMAPAFEQAADRLRTRVRFAKLNTDELQALAGRYGIRSIPTMIVFQGGKEIKRVSGALDAHSMVQWITS